MSCRIFRRNWILFAIIRKFRCIAIKEYSGVKIIGTLLKAILFLTLSCHCIQSTRLYLKSRRRDTRASQWVCEHPWTSSNTTEITPVKVVLHLKVWDLLMQIILPLAISKRNNRPRGFYCFTQHWPDGCQLWSYIN